MKKIINEYANYTVPFYGPAAFVVKKAKGSLVWDIDNNKYIDFTAGIAVTNLGHSNDVLTKIMQKQSKDLWHLSNLYINEPAVKLAKKLCQKTIKLYNKISIKKYKGKVINISEDKFYGKSYQDMKLRIPNIDRARKELGWKPITSINESLIKTLKSYITN